ncbi:Riboflavin kinase [Nakaseomyces bracarensis]|uniref:Riboflavin kinase n=1 Tax=Nakaseomyces bracarensis TaxID=273131 RepID=A0ABR4NU80_9SACH
MTLPKSTIAGAVLAIVAAVLPMVLAPLVATWDQEMILALPVVAVPVAFFMKVFDSGQVMYNHVVYSESSRGRDVAVSRIGTRWGGSGSESASTQAEAEAEIEADDTYISWWKDDLSWRLVLESKSIHSSNHKDEIQMTVRDVDVPIPEAPKGPYPITTTCCDVICGFGRGSSELGIPTANVPMTQLPELVNKLELGVYFGYARLSVVDGKEDEEIERQDGRGVTYNYGKHLEESNGDLEILPVVLSVGKNPFYNNDYKTVEIHILHDFHHTFYGAKIKFNILGYIRPELNYTTKEALIEDINTDIDIARQVLDTEHYRSHMADLI